MTDFIFDQKTGRCVARITSGKVFLDSRDGEQIGTVRAGNIYDLEGSLVGHLNGEHVIGNDDAMPISFQRLVTRVA